MPILAVAGGEAGDILHIVQTRHSDARLADGHDLVLKTLYLQDQVQGLWTDSQGPILQVQFGQTNGEPNAWLAVRCPRATLLFRPILCESKVSVGPHIPLLCSPRNRPIFRFDPNHIATLPIQRSGGSPHVDFSFNPWNSYEMAIIDQNQNWSVWKIRSVNMSDSAWQLHPGPSGRLTATTAHFANSEYTQLALDGWSIVKWVNEGRALLFFGRKNGILFDLQNGSEQLIGLDLGLEDTSDCILDVQQTSSSHQYLFVLTSSRVFWLRLNIEHSGSREQPRFALQILQSWHHLRYEEAGSLRFEILDRKTSTIIRVKRSLCDWLILTKDLSYFCSRGGQNSRLSSLLDLPGLS